ncbi:hypothetical protein M413DRAFT_248226 [Hebeloma cylindrosporum]|uniref:Uncharacterized protein n=1 Tax=Hebeloma cylindrosporum TaxID=76867 RepID=A0A0C2YB44_HEBCY|nr:hypothetical protein M413DRAFT_248226 [Hebeloma cylindrosporum h7]
MCRILKFPGESGKLVMEMGEREARRDVTSFWLFFGRRPGMAESWKWLSRPVKTLRSVPPRAARRRYLTMFDAKS